MNTYTSKSTVDRQEAEALKEMIFNRVRARAEAMSQDAQSSYVDDIHNDLMDEARNSFIATKNPFSLAKPTKISENNTIEAPKKVELKKPEPKEKTKEYEAFEAWLASNEMLNFQAETKTNIENKKIINNTIETTMEDARGTYEKKSTFIGALDFLNSQASISLIYQKGKRFEANA